MKRSILAGIVATLSLGVGAAYAQTAPESVWSSTKEVQKVSNKQLFEDASIKGSHIHAVVLSPTWNISKGVASINRTEAVGQANIAGGSSDWQISKGVQKIQRKKSSDTEKKYFRSSDEISGSGK
ncbi:MAG: hypothetical protein QM762_22810 [Chryseolinea sp.]